MTEKLFALHRHNGDGMTLEDVRRGSAVIHYRGRNKPWKPGYMGELTCSIMKQSLKCQRTVIIELFFVSYMAIKCGSSATELPHFCITPRGVEADGTDLLAALHRVDGQLPSRAAALTDAG